MDFQRAASANARWAKHLECWYGRSYAGRLVRYRGVLHFVKDGWFKPPGARERDRLGYLLGRDVVNVASVEVLDPPQVAQLRAIGVELRPELPPDRVWLSRFACTASARDLPLETLDEAMAGELVYSLWIRRRDAHAFNRAFVQGLPVFFDFETAFLGEPELRDLGAFFAVGGDPGYAGLWRLDVGTHERLDTCALRAGERARFRARAPQPVWVHARGREAFHAALDRTCEAIRSMPGRRIAAAVRAAGFDRRTGGEIRAFLRQNQARLVEHVAVLKRLLDAPRAAGRSDPARARDGRRARIAVRPRASCTRPMAAASGSRRSSAGAGS